MATKFHCSMQKKKESLAKKSEASGIQYTVIDSKVSEGTYDYHNGQQGKSLGIREVPIEQDTFNSLEDLTKYVADNVIHDPIRVEPWTWYAVPSSYKDAAFALVCYSIQDEDGTPNRDTGTIEKEYILYIDCHGASRAELDRAFDDAKMSAPWA